MIKSTLFILIFFQVLLNTGYSQIKNIGVPFIRNYPKREYKAGTQNWGIAQDQKGFMYFANNEGLLVFDGVTWHLSKMPNSSLTRSVYIHETEGIFVGAYNELGKMANPNPATTADFVVGAIICQEPMVNSNIP